MITKIKVIEDSYNTYTPDDLFIEFEEYKGEVRIKTSESDREFAISKRDLIKYVRSLDHDTEE